jgi:hypothetical protein
MDDKIQDPVVRALAEYIKTPVFQRNFEQFFLDHALSFTDDVEHQLAYMTIYIEFQHMFNEHMKSAWPALFGAAQRWHRY